MKSPTALDELIEALRCLPGVGPKSAQRIAYHLLQYDKMGAARLAESLSVWVVTISTGYFCVVHPVL